MKCVHSILSLVLMIVIIGLTSIKTSAINNQDGTHDAVTASSEIADNQDLIIQANEAYAEGKYSTAIELYRSVIGNGLEAAALYFNLGNAYFKSGDFASSIYYYEKALRLDPSDDYIRFNLNVANTKIIDRIEVVPEPFYRKWWKSLSESFPMKVWAIFGLITFFLVLLFAGFFLISQSEIRRKIAFWTGVLFLVLAILTNLLAYEQYAFVTGSPEAIIFEPTVNVKGSPDEKSQDIFVIHEGTKVMITDKVGEWCEIKIANGSVGWINSSVLREI